MDLEWGRGALDADWNRAVSSHSAGGRKERREEGDMNELSSVERLTVGL